MGFAIAEALANEGAQVHLVSGPVSLKPQNPSINLIPVQTATEMLSACLGIFEKTDGAILSAAVADFRPKSPVTHKIKRKGSDLTVILEPNPDIAAELGKLKKENQFLAGFALETEDGIALAKGKLERKNFDFIVLNSLLDKGSGFNTDTNKITIISRYNKITEFELKAKQEVATDIIHFLANLIHL
jgi:phosphopantothenoylcysteine decarboxylase/phosphopantothenate--cysteine ligase